ncbi:hypothetical protein AB0M61_48000 [Streptomyces sp. NPDC051642]|uniref:hypothetical protein n=1 Tax=Streptomyces sp. NPDC051642 TaxID=3154646 RepID=UPI0034408EC6
MKTGRFSSLAVAATVVGLTGVIVPGAGVSYAASGVALPIAGFSHLSVDAAHGHLFLSGGAGTDGILVTDLDGGDPTTIEGEPGATGLALSDDGSTVYAALPDQDAIAAIDTNTLTEKARYGTGTGTRPDSLAVAGGTLWFGYGGAGAGGIGSVDATGAVRTARDSGSWAGSPLLATTPTSSGTLVAAVQTGDTSAFVTYRVADGGLTRQAARALPVPDLTDFAVTADGQDVAVTSWRNPNANRFRVSDLAADGRFADPLAARAVAVAPDGTLAGCGCDGDEFRAVPVTGSGFYGSHAIDSPLRLAAHGLAWAPDESRLYGVAVDADGGSPTLQVAKAPETAAVRLNGSATSPLAPGEPVSLSASFDSSLSLTTSDHGQLPGSIRILRYDSAHPDGVAVTDPTRLPATAANPFGGYAVHDTAPPTGTLSYRVDYSGGGHYAPATRTFDIPLAKYAPTTTLSAPTAGNRAAPLTVTGQLAWPHAHLTTGTVHVVKKDLAHPSGYALPVVPVAADGTFAFRDTPQVGGANTYTVTYDGGTAYLPVTAVANVQVSRATSALSVTTDAASYGSGATAKVTAHLGTTYNSRTVTLYAQPAGQSRTQLKSGHVDSSGNLVAYDRIGRNTTFTAVFAGDYRYAPRTVTHAVTLTPTVRTQLQWPLATTRIGSTTYQVLYKSEVNMGLSLKVTPHQTAGCMSVSVERYTSGAWHPSTSQRCVPLYSDGSYGYSRALKLFADNGRYRVRGHYTPPAAGARTGAAWSGWVYLTVRPGRP